MGVIPEIRVITPYEKERVKAEASHFIDEILRDFLARTHMPVALPVWKWSPEWPFVFYPPDLILVPNGVVILSWIYDEEKTKRALKFSLGHEYAHYLQYQTRPRLWGRWGSEVGADIQATRLTGITPRENQVLWNELITGVVATKGLRSPLFEVLT